MNIIDQSLSALRNLESIVFSRKRKLQNFTDDNMCIYFEYLWIQILKE